MDAIGQISAKNIVIERRIESYTKYPNVITIHPTLASYNDDDSNIICIVDLAQQNFQICNQEHLDSCWWLSFQSYCAVCRPMLNTCLSHSEKTEMDEESEEMNEIANLIFDYLSGSQMKLSGDHHVAELFADRYYETDSLIVLNTPSPAACFDFLSFSADNPYASNIDQLQLDENHNKENKPKNNNDEQYKVQMLRADAKHSCLYQWHEILLPKIASPTSTSRESPECVYNDMLKHWECKLSQDLRFLIIFPEKLGEICDVSLTSNGKLYWIQSLNGSQSQSLEKSFDFRRIFAFNECNVLKQFECKTKKLLCSVEQPSRFKIMPCGEHKCVVWNFSINGASEDLFCVIHAEGTAKNGKLNNKLLAINNAQNFNNYRFEDGNLQDLIRDVPKLCSLNGSIIFGGACFLSILSADNVDKIAVYDSEEDGKRLICNEVSRAFCYDTFVPIDIATPQDNSKWITDYVPFRGNSILARWLGTIGKTVYGVWQYNKQSKKWLCTKSDEYDEMKWSASTMCCYHFGDRIKTLLLSIQLQHDDC